MKTKLFICLLVFIGLLGESCAGRRALVENKVFTQYTSNNQKNVWKDKEAIKKVPLQSLRILIIDATDTKENAQFKEPLRVYSDHPLSEDSLIESKYYNQLVLNAFKKKLPSKAKVRVLTRNIPKTMLDSLKATFDVVITAQQIQLDYKFRFIGYNNSDFQKHFVNNHSTRSFYGKPFYPTRPTVIGGITEGGMTYNFQVSSKQPDVLTRAVIYRTAWNLQWMNEANKPQTDQLHQEGIIVTHRSEAIELNSANEKKPIWSFAATKAGETLAQVFKW